MTPARLVSRPNEDGAITDFLDRMASTSSALVLEGDAGIGKTTVWFAAIERARERTFTVLSARTAESESVLAYAGLADLLSEVDAAVWADLPHPQTLALEQVLLRSDEVRHETDRRAVAAGFLSVIDGLVQQAPLLLAIDDLQWLDASTVHAIAFVARRLPQRVGVLATERIDPAGGSGCTWLQLPKPDDIKRVTVGPLSLGGLTAVVTDRLGRSVSRPTMVRIAEISGGNPFYALELARVMESGPTGEAAPLPSTLADLVQARIGSLGSDVQEVLLAAACMKAPTIEFIARATDADTETVARSLEAAADQGLVTIHGHQLRFAHPLLAKGVYTSAGRSRRRNVHRRLADLVEEAELQARHLALASVSGNPKTLSALDKAAKIARARGAPAAAAELLDLALGLGGDTPERRIRSAQNHRDAGDLRRSKELLRVTIEQLEPGGVRADALNQLAAVSAVEGDYRQAAGLLESALSEAGEDDGLCARILVSLTFALLHGGRIDAALRTVDHAVAAAERAGHPHLLCQALSLRINLRFLRGDGVDGEGLQRALELEDPHAPIPMTFRPSVHHAMYLSWTGDLERAREATAAVAQRCIDRGEENDLIHVTFHSFQIEFWLGNLGQAAAIADDAMQRAHQLGGDLALATALTMRALLGAHAGRDDQTRADADTALAASLRSGAHILAVWPITALGLLEVSLGNHAAALSMLNPLLTRLAEAPEALEICVAPYLPDAVEALISVGQLTEAQALIDRLERSGRRLDRAWLLAVGARGRSMLLAARGELDAASEAAQSAIGHHQRLQMPFELARTQLVVGQLQRRQRQRDDAVVSIRNALGVFDDLGCALWAGRARGELDRATVVRNRETGELTKTERRVAELVASGMTNREVAAELFISPKTVEVNLSRVYRKLGIRSRAGLARRIDGIDELTQ